MSRRQRQRRPGRQRAGRQRRRPDQRRWHGNQITPVRLHAFIVSPSHLTLGRRISDVPSEAFQVSRLRRRSIAPMLYNFRWRHYAFTPQSRA